MSKNNVGSLYVEILLSPDGYKKGAAAIRRDQSALSSFLKKDINEVMTEREAAAAEARRLGEANWRANKNDAAKRQEIQKAIIRSYKSKIKAINAAEEKLAQDQADRGLQEVSRAIQNINKVKAAKLKAIADIKMLGAGGGGGNAGFLDHIAGGGGIADFLQGKGGMLGSMGKFAGIMSTVSNVVGRTTMFIWPLVQAFKALGRVVGAVTGTMMSWMKMIDDYKMGVKSLAMVIKGGVPAAKKLAKEIEAYAMKTSLSVEAGMKMATTLTNLGVESDFVMIRLKQFNQVAKGNEDQFKRLAKAYTDVVGAGRLMATEHRQFTEAGVPIDRFLQKILDDAGRFTGNIRQMMKDGLISAEDVGKALDAMGEEYAGADYMGLETLSGKLENLSEEIQSFFRHSEAGKKLNRIFNEMLETVGKLTTKVLGAMSALEKYSGIMLHTLSGANEVLKGMERSMELVMMMRSFLATGDAMRYRKEYDLAARIAAHNAKVREKEARAQADLAAKRKKDDEDRLARVEKYKALMEELWKRDPKNKQEEYQQWHAGSISGQGYSHEQQLFAITAWYEKQLEQAQEEKRKALEDIDKSTRDNERSRFEAALQASLPQDAFRQNSVEEFRYLQQQRKQADRDRREQRRFEEEQRSRKDAANDIVEAVRDIDLSNITPI